MMPGTPIEQLSLSVRACNLLHRMNIHYVEDFLTISLEEVEKQRNVGKKTIAEIKQALVLATNGEVEFTYELPEDDNAVEGFSDAQLSEMSRHSISELKLSTRPNNALTKEGYITIDKVAMLTKDDIKQFKGLGQKSIDEIVNSIDKWLDDNRALLANVNKDNCISEEIQDIFINLAQEIEPLTRVYWRHLFQWISDAGKIEMVEVNAESISLDNNIRIILTLPEMQLKLKSLWFRYTSKGMIAVNDLEERLKSLGLNFDYRIVIECFCMSFGVFRHRDCFLLPRKNIIETLSSAGEINERSLNILKMRIKGNSLQEVGDAFGCTRERVRQIVKKIVHKLPLLFEDYFAEPFEAFHFSKLEFIRLFPEVSEEGYEYLAVRYQKGKNILSEDTISEYSGHWKNRLYSYIGEEAERIDKQTITRTKIVYRVLISNANKSLTMEEFESEYYNYIKRKGLSDEKLKLNMKTLSNHLRNARGIVFNRDSKVRYCDADPMIIWNFIDFNAYCNLVISADLIYRDYADLMEELDIRDGYELFYIIKSSLRYWHGSFDIICRRIPIMVLGNASEEVQAIKLLKEISPVKYDDYYVAYEERFGVRKESAQGNSNISNAVIPYYLDGKYVIDAPSFADEDVDELVKVLDSKSIWFIDEIEDLYDKICVHSTKDALNASAFRRIGYILNTGYIYRETYGTVTNYFDQEIFSKDVVDISQLDRRLVALPSFASILDKKKNLLEYIETAPKVLLSSKKIYEVYGLTTNEIKQIQISLSEQYKKPYFNAHSIWDEIQSLPLIHKLRGNEWMLTCIMRQQEIVASQHFAGNIILSLDSSTLSVSRICEWLASINGKMTIHVLEKTFNDMFGCHVSNDKLAYKLRSSGTWESVVTDSMDDYIDKLVEFTDIEEDGFFKEEFF